MNLTNSTNIPALLSENFCGNINLTVTESHLTVERL